jgi:multicomponent Na+:H+ antiporter subunit A
MYEAKLQAPQAGWLITGAGVLANMLIVAVAGVVGIRPFLGHQTTPPKKPHEAPLSLWLGPVVLAALGLVIGLLPDSLGKPLVSPAVNAVRGEVTDIKLALWHGLNPVLALSLLTILCGIAVFALRGVARRIPWPSNFTVAQAYKLGLDGLNMLARAQTRLVQSGYLRFYLLLIIATTVGLAGYTLINRVELSRPAGWSEIRFYEWTIAVIMLAAVVAAVRASSRLAAVAALGVVGYGVALMFMLFGAPDLAITQFAIETLSVILFVLVLYRLPRFATFSGAAARVRDAAVALAAGGLITTLVLAATAVPPSSRLMPYFAENSVPLANGRNVVNVILVDFRGFDTLGEITVLAVGAIGVYALLRLRPETTKESSDHDS